MKALITTNALKTCSALSKTDYFDIMLLHWQHDDKWFDETKRWQEGIEISRTKSSSTRMEPACMAYRRCGRCREIHGCRWP